MIPKQFTNITISNYKIGNKIAVGTFSHIYECFNINTHQKLIMKTIPKKPEIDGVELDIKHAKRELEILCQLSHPNILKHIETINDEDYFIIITEYCEGITLLNYITLKGNLESKIVRLIVRQLLDALNYLHSNFIAHRDLKLENIIINTLNNHITIIDFGLSNYINSSNLLNTFCGSLQYVSPKIIEQKPYDGALADIWSLGIVFLYMLTGKFPWPEDNITKLVNSIQEGKVFYPYYLNIECTNTISKMLSKDPKNRPNAIELLNNSWFSEKNISLGLLPKLVNFNKSDQTFSNSLPSNKIPIRTRISLNERSNNGRSSFNKKNLFKPNTFDQNLPINFTEKSYSSEYLN